MGNSFDVENTHTSTAIDKLNISPSKKLEFGEEIPVPRSLTPATTGSATQFFLPNS